MKNFILPFITLLISSPIIYANETKTFTINSESKYGTYLTFYEIGSSTYCDDPEDFGTILHHEKGIDRGEQNVKLSVDQGTQFCIEVEHGSDVAGGEIMYQGPYSADSGQCVFEVHGTPLYGLDPWIHTVLFATQGCLPDHYAHNKVRHSLSDKEWPEKYILEIYERGTSRDCDKDSGQGERLIRSGLFEDLDFYFTTEANTEFCIDLEEINLDRRLGLDSKEMYYGPFQAGEAINIALENESEQACKIHVTDSRSHTDEGCKGEGYITFSIPLEEYDAEVHFYEKGTSDDCAHGSGRGEMIAETRAHTGDFNMRLNEGQSFCVEAIDTYAGPYKANLDCTLTMTADGGDLTPTSGCALLDTTVMSFSNKDSRNYDVTLSAVGESTSCADDSDRGAPLVDTFKVSAGASTTVRHGIYDKWFCLATKNGSDKGYFGPFEAQEGCIINVLSHGVAALGTNCDTNHTARVTFEYKPHISTQDAKVEIYERGDSLDCGNNSHRGHVSAVFDLGGNAGPVSIQTPLKNNFTGEVTDQFCLTLDDAQYRGPYLKSDDCTISMEINNLHHYMLTASDGCKIPEAD